MRWESGLHAPSGKYENHKETKRTHEGLGVVNAILNNPLQSKTTAKRSPLNFSCQCFTSSAHIFCPATRTHGTPQPNRQSQCHCTDYGCSVVGMKQGAKQRVMDQLNLWDSISQSILNRLLSEMHCISDNTTHCLSKSD